MQVLAMFSDIVYLCHLNPQAVHPPEAGRDAESPFWTANLTPAPARRRIQASKCPETALGSRTSRLGRSRHGGRAGRRFRRPGPRRPPSGLRPHAGPSAFQSSFNPVIRVRIRHHVLKRAGNAVQSAGSSPDDKGSGAGSQTRLAARNNVRYNRPPVRNSRTINSRMTAPMVE